MLHISEPVPSFFFFKFDVYVPVTVAMYHINFYQLRKTVIIMIITDVIPCDLKVKLLPCHK